MLSIVMLSIVMLSIVMLSIVILSIVMPSIVMLSVEGPRISIGKAFSGNLSDCERVCAYLGYLGQHNTNRKRP